MIPESPRNKSIATAPASKSRPTCRTCGYYGGPSLSCHRGPTPLHSKAADEWCGEHPDFPDYLKSLRSK